MEEQRILPSNKLRDYIAYNTNEFIIQYSENQLISNKQLEFEDIKTKSKYIFYYNKNKKEFIFAPKDKYNIVETMVLHKELKCFKIYMDIQDRIIGLKKQLTEQGYYEEKYIFGCSLIDTDMYSLKDTITAILNANLNKKSLEISFPNVSKLFKFCKMESTLQIHAQHNDYYKEVKCFVHSRKERRIIQEGSLTHCNIEEMYLSFASYINQLFEILPEDKQQQKRRFYK